MKSILIAFIVAVVALVKGDLFAIVGGSQCAQSLNYGPSTMNVQVGSEDGHLYYFTTSSTGVTTAHTNWLQIVTSDGYTELFRILYTFDTAMTLVDRFAQDTISTVSFVVTDTAGLAGAAGTQYPAATTWQFSSTSTIDATEFAVGATTLGFSFDDGAWGAASTAINGGVASIPADFWGLGNFDGGDSACQTIYAMGNPVPPGSYPNSRSYMFTGTTGYVATHFPTSQPSNRPSSRPSTQPSSRPSRQPSSRPTGQPSKQPSSQPSRQPSGQPSRQPTSAPSRFARKRGYRMRNPPTSG